MSDFTELVDLAAERLGGAVLAANDEFFAPKENLLKAAVPVWLEGRYTDVGKWMDGWETRRRREPGHDWCLIRLGLSGVPRGVVVDTAHFKGNFPEACSLEACAVEGYPTPDELFAEGNKWNVILPRTHLRGDSLNTFRIDKDFGRVTHLLFRIYPDGGVARLRVYGDVVPDWERLERRRSEIDLAAAENGGLVLSCSDMFFGNRHNLLWPGPPTGMHDGWETRRRRGEGHDWAIVRLGARGSVHRLEIDTSFFKGNAPGSAWVEGVDSPGVPTELITTPWRVILAQTPLRPHTVHRFDQVLDAGPVTHLRLNIDPDGGVARLRAFGTIAPLDLLNVLPEPTAAARLLACCGSRAWASKLAQARPFREPGELFAAAESAFDQLDRDDWLEAFAAHPRIGERTAGDDRSSRWSEQEQAGAEGAPPEILEELAQANRLYEDRFGHVFLVCATGKSAFEMLNLLSERLGNDRDTELKVAAAEQRKITRLRLEKML
jgi:allantoicase